jgi:hypothetical protein
MIRGAMSLSSNAARDQLAGVIDMSRAMRMIQCTMQKFYAKLPPHPPAAP